MISLKKYLDDYDLSVETTPVSEQSQPVAKPTEPVLSAALAAYGSAMLAMGNCSLKSCPGLGDKLKKSLEILRTGLTIEIPCKELEKTDSALQKQLEEWGHQSAVYYHDKAREVKDLLLVIARSAEAVGTRDQRFGTQMSQVTARLQQIATFDDLGQIRATVEKGAAELKSTIEQMKAEGKAAVEELRREVRVYQAKLEDAEVIASRDDLTGLSNRKCLETMIESRIALKTIFCVAMLDLDGFKKVNDKHGHMVGDELLKLFAAELRSAVRKGDTVGRWGGDEFVMILDCDLAEARSRVDRLSQWLPGDYTIRGREGPLVVRIAVSLGLAAHRTGERTKSLMERADTEMYQRKGAARRAK